jgi:alkylation response protein AidB-like acyl-CoA dehydrogenase
MASKWVDERDMRFILHEVFNIQELLLGKAPFEDHDTDMVNMVLDAAAKFAENEIAPTYPDEVHRKPIEAVFKDGKVYAPESYHRLWKLYAESGWLSTADSPEVGGQGLPEVVAAACANMFLATNQAFTMYPGLSHGAAKLVEKFFEHPFREMILEKMFTGQWAGTMCLTEPGAGSDVGALKSTAKRNPDGSYFITGTKSFISAGDHDLTENIIHPVLARIEGDPPGTKGISIFVVPKFKINADGSLGELNDVATGNIESKTWQLDLYPELWRKRQMCRLSHGTGTRRHESHVPHDERGTSGCRHDGCGPCFVCLSPRTGLCERSRPGF